MKPKTILLITAILCSFLSAGPSSQKEDEMRREREKEVDRAKEAAARLADREGFEKRYERIKNNDPGLYANTLEKQLQAAQAWRTTAEQVARANSRDEIIALKMPAQNAEDVAEIARLEMRAAEAEKEWKSSVEKSGSKETAALAGQLVQNQNAIVQATKQHKASQKTLRQLELERMNLDKKMREAQENAREQSDRNMDKNPSRDGDKKPSRVNGGRPDGDRPFKPNVE